MKITGALVCMLILSLFPYRIAAQDLGDDPMKRPMNDNDLRLCLGQFQEQAVSSGATVTGAAVPTATQDMISTGKTELRGARRIQETKSPLGASEVEPQVTTAVSLVTGEKDGRGLISFSHNRQSSYGIVDDLSLKVSVPFNKTEGQASFASLSGLSGDIVASGAFTRFRWDLDLKGYGEALCNTCKSQGVSLLMCDETNLPLALQKQGRTEEEITRIMQPMEQGLFGDEAAKLWGFEGSVGRKERSFFEPAGTKSKEDRVGYSLAITGGALFESWSLYGRVTGKRDFKDRNSATLCSPITGSVLESCSSLPLGEAAEVESVVAAVEARHFFRTFAFAPSAQFDFESSIWGLEAPVFLTRDQKGAFTGGIKLGWRSDERDLITTIFVTKGLEP